MRWLAHALAVLALTSPRLADACCAAVPCPKTARWRALHLLNEDPLPRDGVLLFSGFTDSRQCIDALEPFIKIEVRRGDVAIVGSAQLADGRGGNFIWRPAVPWEPGQYHLSIKIDNDAIGPPDSGEETLGCPADCPDPGVVVFDEDFVVGPEFSPPIPVLPVPQLSLDVQPIDDRMSDLACCPGLAPTAECCGGVPCWPEWELGACAPIYERRRMAIAVPPHPVPSELAGQLLYELRAGGEPIGRAFDPTRLAEFGSRSTPDCIELVALHLGSGEIVMSNKTCPDEQISSALGVHLYRIFDELACADPVLCGTGDLEWDPNACTLYDPLALPPPPVFDEPTFDAPCPIAQGPWLSPEPASEPTTSATGPDDPGTSGAPDSATAGGDVLVDHGCTCNEPPGSALAIPLLAPLFLRRRRPAA